MIIIEGTDGTGKTTLAKALIAHLKLSHQSYVHVSQPPPGATWPAWTQYTEMIRSSLVPSNGIIDRFIYGESVYGPIMRCDHRFTAAYRRMLERVLLNRRTVVVFCKPPYEWARKNWDQRNQQGGEYVTKTELHRQTYDRFIEVMAAAHLPVVTFDPTKDTVQQVICRLIAAKPPINPGPGYGWYEKGVTLLVGDQVNDHVGIDGWPFVAPSGCSPWLAEQLENHCISERSLYWINHLSPEYLTFGNKISTEAEFIYDLKPGRIIALGDNAAGWCTRKGLLHVKVPHPQFWRRFRSADAYPLIDVLTRSV